MFTTLSNFKFMSVLFLSESIEVLNFRMVGTGGVENGQIEVAQPNPVGQSAPLNTLVEGCRLPVNRNKDDAQGDWTPAEILSIRKNSNGENQYYVHYVDFNKRLDEWVTQHRLDHRKGPL